MNGIPLKQIDRTNLIDQTKLRLSEISKIEKYINSTIEKIKLSSNTLSIYVAAFYYIDKILIVLSETSGGVSIISFLLLELL